MDDKDPKTPSAKYLRNRFEVLVCVDQSDRLVGAREFGAQRRPDVVKLVRCDVVRKLDDALFTEQDYTVQCRLIESRLSLQESYDQEI